MDKAFDAILDKLVMAGWIEAHATRGSEMGAIWTEKGMIGAKLCTDLFGVPNDLVSFEEFTAFLTILSTTLGEHTGE